MIVIDEQTAHALFDMRSAIPALEQSFRIISGPGTKAAVRDVVDDPRHDLFALMLGGYLGDMDAFCFKMVGRFENSQKQTLLWIDARTGEPAALLIGGYACDFRTGAASAVATARLARTNATRLAVLGTGAQAVTQVQGVCAVRPITAVTAWNRTPARGREWAARMAGLLGPDGPPITLMETPEDAVADADIVVVSTSSETPVLAGAWLRPGTHINAVGAGAPRQREIDTDVLRRSDIVTVDSRETALRVGDFTAVPADAFDPATVAELGEVLLGTREGRTDEGQITLFKSVGHIANDVAIVKLAVQQLSEKAHARAPSSALKETRA